MSYYRTPVLNSDKNLQSYIIGLAIGDGNLSNPNKRAARLRITCDLKYPFLIEKIRSSLQSLFPENKVSITDRSKSGCLDLSIYSNHLENLLGWKVGKGSKIVQRVSVPNWIKANNIYSINCLRGLIETDGSIYTDRKYKMVIFCSKIKKLALDVHEMMTNLDFAPHIYKTERKDAGSFMYQVRLSKNVQNFIDIVKPEKA